MERRDFLAASGLAFGAAVAARAGIARAGGPEAKGTPARDTATTPSVSDWASIRALFALDPTLIHMAGFYLASHPAPVREAIERHRRALDANPLWEHHGRAAEHELPVLKAAGEYLGADWADIALTDSTTMGLGLVYTGLTLREGQEVLTTEHDHYSTRTALEYRAQRTGAAVRRIPLYDRGANASVDGVVSAIRSAMTPKTRIVAITWVHSGTGVKLPIRAIADALAEVNASRAEADRAMLCVDGVHGIGVEDETVGSLGCDFFMAGTHKWMFGPRGTGLVWASARAQGLLQNTIPPFVPTHFRDASPAVPDSDPTWGMLATPGGFHSFEHRWALLEAFQLHMAIGKPRVQARIHALNTQLKDGLAKMPHVTLHTPRSEMLSAGIVCFEIAGMTPQEVVDRLKAKKIVASVTPYAVKYARLAPGLLNSEQEIDVTLREVRALASG